MTRQELETAIADETGYGLSVDNRVLTRIRRFLNEGVRAVLSEPGLSKLADSDSPYTFASVVGQSRYAMPESVAFIRHLSERTNDWRIQPMSLATYRAIHPDPETYTGTPTHYVPIGRVAVATQPSDASSLFVNSTSGSEIHTAYIEGIVSGGYRRTAAVTITGTTAVNVDTAITDWIEVTDFYLSHDAIGTVSLYEDSGAGTELARITVGEMRPRYMGLYLWPTPAAVVTYYVDHRQELQPLTTSTDEPPLPSDYHEMLVAFGTWREWMFKGDVNRASEAKTRYEKWLSRLKYATQAETDEIPVVGGRRIGHSRLGSEYPADTWSRY